jgi:transposase
MDAIVVGIDVSKDRLDVAVRPTGETFAVERDAEGLSRLIARLAPLEPQAIAVEATGGYETVVAASLSAAGCQSSWSIRRRCAPSPRRSENVPRPTRSTRR